MFAVVSVKSLEDPVNWYSYFHLTFVFSDFELARQRCDDFNTNCLFPRYRVVKINFENL